MESLTRLVAESLARHGFDRPLDYRRLSWSRWFRCESHHSLLFVPSKPGVFAVAEEIIDLAPTTSHVAADAFVRPDQATPRTPEAESRKPEAAKRMLAVTQFFEADDMAFVLDRMLSRHHPMSTRLASGRYFVRFVAIDDQSQRTTICNALNQWMVSTAEKATGIGPHFATSLELTPATEYVPQPDDRQQSLFPSEAHVGRTLLSANADATNAHVGTDAFVRPASEASGVVEERRFSAASSAPQEPAASAVAGRRIPAHAISPPPTTPQLDSGAATNIHCPSPFPSGF